MHKLIVNKLSERGHATGPAQRFMCIIPLTPHSLVQLVLVKPICRWMCRGLEECLVFSAAHQTSTWPWARPLCRLDSHPFTLPLGNPVPLLSFLKLGSFPQAWVLSNSTQPSSWPILSPSQCHLLHEASQFPWDSLCGQPAFSFGALLRIEINFFYTPKSVLSSLCWTEVPQGPLYVTLPPCRNDWCIRDESSSNQSLSSSSFPALR